MPMYEYRCRTCQQPFETLVTAERRPLCPACGSTDLDKQLSVFAVSSRSAAPTPAMAPCGTCGDPRGAGACRLEMGSPSQFGGGH
jgi:putative FmdB family regulatory protein